MLRSETAASPERMSRALEGLRKYQEAPREPRPAPMPAIVQLRGSSLRDYGGSGPPVLFVPSLINPPTILDLSADKSLLRWLAERGNRVLLLDWGCGAEERRSLSVADHVTEIVIPMIEALDEPPALVGYCLGGTMAVAAAALAPVRSLATLAAPWHFGGFPDEARAMLAKLWASSDPAVRALGVLPMEVLQSSFWSLDPGRTVSKFESFASMDPESPQARAFVTLEDWANDGPPISEAAARELFEGFLRDDAPGSGGWIVGGRPVAPEAVSCPIFNIVSTTDRIVPRDTAIGTGERLDLDQGHVGMVVGSRARAALWQPLADWLSRTAAS